MAYYKVPEYIHFKCETDFPLTASGKVLKYRIREETCKDMGLQMN